MKILYAVLFHIHNSNIFNGGQRSQPVNQTDYFMENGADCHNLLIDPSASRGSFSWQEHWADRSIQRPRVLIRTQRTVYFVTAGSGA